MLIFEHRNHLTSAVGLLSHYPLKRPIFSSDVGVQTETTVQGRGPSADVYEPNKMATQDDQESTLSASDLASILKWSKDISSDINLSSGKVPNWHRDYLSYPHSFAEVNRNSNR